MTFHCVPHPGQTKAGFLSQWDPNRVAATFLSPSSLALGLGLFSWKPLGASRALSQELLGFWVAVFNWNRLSYIPSCSAMCLFFCLALLPCALNVNDQLTLTCLLSIKMLTFWLSTLPDWFLNACVCMCVQTHLQSGFVLFYSCAILLTWFLLLNILIVDIFLWHYK